MPLAACFKGRLIGKKFSGAAQKGAEWQRFTQNITQANMSIFLSDVEIADLTNCKSPDAQEHWLRSNGVKCYRNATNRLIVARALVKTRKSKKHDKTFDDLTTIIANSVPRRGVGIYFLLDADSVLYVGQTTNFFSRMGAHIGSDVPYTSITFIATQEDELDLFEVEYIKRLKPQYNIRHNK